MNAESTKKPDSGEINIAELAPMRRSAVGGAHTEREALERAALQRIDGRKLRTKGRIVTLSTKVKPETMDAIQRIASVEGMTMVEVIELAIDDLSKKMRGVS
mgnify:CR=1 FL=1